MVQSILTRTGLTRFVALTLLVLSLFAGVIGSPAQPASAHDGGAGTLCGYQNLATAAFLFEENIPAGEGWWIHGHWWEFPDYSWGFYGCYAYWDGGMI